MYKEEYAFTFLILSAWLEGRGMLWVLGVLSEGTIEWRDFLHVPFSDGSVLPIRIGCWAVAAEQTEEDKAQGIRRYGNGPSYLKAEWGNVQAILMLRSHNIQNLTANVRLGFAEGTRRITVPDPSTE